jgi:hypothetical protein
MQPAHRITRQPGELAGMGRPFGGFRDRQPPFQQLQAMPTGLMTMRPAGNCVSVARAPWSGNLASAALLSFFGFFANPPSSLSLPARISCNSESTSAGSSFLDGIPGATRGRRDSEEDRHSRSCCSAGAAVIVLMGKDTACGEIAQRPTMRPQETELGRGVRHFGMSSHG